LPKNPISVRISEVLYFSRNQGFMERIKLQGLERSNPVAEKIRKDGMIPAIVYGHNLPTEHFAIPYGEFEKAFRKAGESTIITLVVGGHERNVIVQDVQRHYLTDRFQHIDFHEIKMNEKMKAKIPLEFIGVSNAVKALGGTLLQVMNEVEVECFPIDLPHTIEVDISSLNTFEDAIHISDLKISDKVQILASAEDTVATVTPPRDVEAELAAPIEENVAAVEGVADAPKEGEEPAASSEEK
jgi:large subunit ribosomal protein L25